MDYTLPSDILSLTPGKRWVYTTGTFIFTREINLSVMDRRAGQCLINFSSGGIKGSAVMQCDVDLSLIAVSKELVDTLDDDSSLEPVQKVELLKSPLITGASWENMLGSFKVVDSKSRLKLGRKVYNDCIYLQLKDTSGAYNDIYIKPGIGIIFASIYIDGFGKVYLNLKYHN